MRTPLAGGGRCRPPARPLLLPIALLLGACLLLVVGGEPVLAYARATADTLHQPQHYIDAVFGARPLPGVREGAKP